MPACMLKQAMGDKTKRLVKEALERKAPPSSRAQTRIEVKCRKSGAQNRVSAA